MDIVIVIKGSDPSFDADERHETVYDEEQFEALVREPLEEILRQVNEVGTRFGAGLALEKKIRLYGSRGETYDEVVIATL